jgi:hypothetical protein
MTPFANLAEVTAPSKIFVVVTALVAILFSITLELPSFDELTALEASFASVTLPSTSSSVSIEETPTLEEETISPISTH